MRVIAALGVTVAVAVTACAAARGPPPGAALSDTARRDPDRFVVVTVKNDFVAGSLPATSTPRGYDSLGPYAASSTARSRARALASDHGLHEEASWPIALLGVHCLVYEIPAGADRATVLAQLRRDRRVESAEPLATFTTQAGEFNDPYAGLQQSLALMAVGPAQQWARGEGVTVAIIDTGIDTAHPDLQGRVSGQRNFVDDDAARFVSEQHGTAVAGVIAALANNRIGIAGIAPGVKLLAFKACWQLSAVASTAACNTFTLAQALAGAIDAHADVVNLSLAGPGDPLLTRIVERGLQQGIIFVGAAPPVGAHSGFPGNVAGVITVDAPGRQVGGAAALVAPGRDVLTLAPNSHYDFASGSSLAAAQVSAVVALLISRDRHLRAEQALHLLQRTSQTVSTPTDSFSSINACEALAALQQHGSCPRASDDGLALDEPHAPGSLIHRP
ncbi:MAG: serine protease [Gammaproteobacteria bacterium]|nr:serine protease [Gammaproteobacteria bacterium]